MSMVLESEMPQRKRRYGLIILFLGLLAISVYGYYSIALNLSSDKEDMAYAEENHDLRSGESENPNPVGNAAELNLKEARMEKNGQKGIAETSKTDRGNISLRANTEIKKINAITKAVSSSKGKESFLLEKHMPAQGTGKAKLSLSDDFKIEAASIASSLAGNRIGEESKSSSILSEVLGDVEKIQALSARELFYERALRPINKLADLPISIKSKSGSWSIGALALIEHIPNFNSTGYGLGLGLNKRISAKWSASLRLAYMINARSLNPGRMALEADMPINEQDMQAGNISGFLSARTLEENTDELNSISLGAQLSYSLSSPLAISTGMTIERYSKRLDLITASPDEQALNQMEEYLVKENSELIPSFDLGIEYRFMSQLAVFASFRKSLKDFYVDDSDVLSTTKLLGGLNYSF